MNHPAEILAPSRAALDMIDRLIAIPTVSCDSNLGLIESVRDHLAGLGVKSRLTYDAKRRKANLFATLADDPERVKAGGIILSGHTDTVPVDGQEWTSDPFVARHVDGRIVGRGSADMKGFIAVALAMAPQLLAAQDHAPIHLAFSYDEEVGCIGVRGLIADLAERGIQPAGCIIGEPTDMQAIVAHKGKRDIRCCVRGREAHSALTPEGVNAIEFAARLVVFIRELADRCARSESDPRFGVPYSTLQTGTMRGGIATNVVARDAEFVFEMRNLPGTEQEALLAEIEGHAREVLVPAMQAVAAGTGVSFELIAELPAFGIAPDAPIVRWAQELARTAHRGAGAVGFGTEASLFARAGIPTVLLGPGSIEQAHKPDEFITYDQVAACEAFLSRMIAAPLPEL